MGSEIRFYSENQVRVGVWDVQVTPRLVFKCDHIGAFYFQGNYTLFWINQISVDNRAVILVDHIEKIGGSTNANIED